MKNTNIIIILMISILIIAIIIGGYFIIESNQKQEKGINNTTIATNKNEETNIEKTSNKRMAVIYFSATGNTRQVAEYIQSETNSDIFEITPKQ